MFNFFRRKREYQACSECGLLYMPPTSGDTYEILFSNYCQVHRKPMIERYRNLQKVKSWAERNWERLLPEATKEERELQNAYTQNLGGLVNKQMNQQNYSLQSVLSGIGSVGQQRNNIV